MGLEDVDVDDGERFREIMDEADEGARALLKRFRQGIGNRCASTHALFPSEVRCWGDVGHVSSHFAGDLSWSDELGLLKRSYEAPLILHPDVVLMDMAAGIDAAQESRGCVPGPSPAGIVAAVEQVKPVGVRLVAVVVNGIPGVPRWWWRWVEPVALWLLRRAGFEVCQ